MRPRLLRLLPLLLRLFLRTSAVLHDMIFRVSSLATTRRSFAHSHFWINSDNFAVDMFFGANEPFLDTLDHLFTLDMIF